MTTYSNSANRIDKMSGMDKKMKQELVGKSKKYIKKFAVHKNCQTIKKLNRIK